MVKSKMKRKSKNTVVEAGDYVIMDVIKKDGSIISVRGTYPAILNTSLNVSSRRMFPPSKRAGTDKLPSIIYKPDKKEYN